MKNNSILDSLKKIYTKMTGKKVVKRKTETDVLSDIAESYNPNQGGGGTTVSGTDDGTNWTSLTIDDKTRAIPQGGSGGGGDTTYIINYDEFFSYLIGKHLSVDALIDLFEDKGIDDELITNCKSVGLTKGYIIGINIECDAEMYIPGKTIPLTNTGATGIIDAIIAKKSEIEAYTYTLENIGEWYVPSAMSTHITSLDNGYVGQCSMNFDHSAIDTFYKFTATTSEELKALFVETE